MKPSGLALLLFIIITASQGYASEEDDADEASDLVAEQHDVDGSQVWSFQSRSNEMEASITGVGQVAFSWAGFTARISPLDVEADGETSAIAGGMFHDGAALQQLLVEVPEGVEHMMIVEPDLESEETVLSFDIDGLVPAAVADDIVVFVDAEGFQRFRYAGLAVWDAFHERQEAWFSTDGQSLSIHIATNDTTVGPLTIDPIGSPVLFTGGSSGSFFGWSTAVASIDGDAFADVLVGEPLYGSGQVNEGRTMLLRGTSTGLSTTTTLTFEGGTANAGCGLAVAAADVDGDGKVDIVDAPARTNRSVIET